MFYVLIAHCLPEKILKISKSDNSLFVWSTLLYHELNYLFFPLLVSLLCMCTCVIQEGRSCEIVCLCLCIMLSCHAYYIRVCVMSMHALFYIIVNYVYYKAVIDHTICCVYMSELLLIRCQSRWYFIRKDTTH